MWHVIDVLRRSARGLDRRAIATTAVALALVAMLAPAAAFPERPIRVIIPLPPGGAVDIVARLLQPHLEKALGKPLIIENKAGASGIVGAATVATADPDGHTLLLVPTTFTINAAVHPKLPFDTIRSFEPIAIVGRNSLMVLVNPKVQAKTLKELAALGEISVISASPVTVASTAGAPPRYGICCILIPACELHSSSSRWAWLDAPGVA
jgi:tripartite-type tricarboxylate transporter receptor subunit TctC